MSLKINPQGKVIERQPAASQEPSLFLQVGEAARLLMGTQASGLDTPWALDPRLTLVESGEEEHGGL